MSETALGLSFACMVKDQIWLVLIINDTVLFNLLTTKQLPYAKPQANLLHIASYGRIEIVRNWDAERWNDIPKSLMSS